MKRLIALMLLLSLLCACGCRENISTQASSFTAMEGHRDETMRIALITYCGGVEEEYYTQVVYDTMKNWCKANGADSRYFMPEDDSTAARVAAMEFAICEGCQILLLPGGGFAEAIVELAPQYPDVRFIGLDVSENALLEAVVENAGEDYDFEPENWNIEDYLDLYNIYCCTYREEVAGYMAGYAAVKMGYTELGFLCEIFNPSELCYSYGFLQGADAAAAETGAKVNVKHAASFYDYAPTAYEAWSAEGTQVTFLCGLYSRMQMEMIAQAQGDGKIIVPDLRYASCFEEGEVLTSAVKDMAATVEMLLQDIAWRFRGDWKKYSGKFELLDAGFVCLSESTQWCESFTKQDYEELVGKITDGTLTVSDDISCKPVTKHITVEYLDYL